MKPSDIFNDTFKFEVCSNFHIGYYSRTYRVCGIGNRKVAQGEKTGLFSTLGAYSEWAIHNYRIRWQQPLINILSLCWQTKNWQFICLWDWSHLSPQGCLWAIQWKNTRNFKKYSFFLEEFLSTDFSRMKVWRILKSNKYHITSPCISLSFSFLTNSTVAW